MINCRGVRGATTVLENSEAAILDGTRKLLGTMLKLNGIDPSAIASIFLTSTSDLHSAFPAAAVRQILGPDIPSLCAREIEVGSAQERCIRILLHWNTEVDQTSIIPVYLNDAVGLVDSVPPEFDNAALTRWVDENVPDLEQEMLKLQKKRRNGQ